MGDYVESGHVLGYVAEPTKYYSVEGSNLYFALQKDGQPVDPVAFFRLAVRAVENDVDRIGVLHVDRIEYAGFLHYNETRDKGGIGTWNSRNTVKL